MCVRATWVARQTIEASGKTSGCEYVHGRTRHGWDKQVRQVAKWAGVCNWAART